MVDDSALTPDRLELVTQAVAGLKAGDAGGWAALAPLTQLVASGNDIAIDLAGTRHLGFPIIIVRPRPGQALPECLSPRQREVAIAVADGASNKEIARALKISPATVKDHVGATLAALKFKRRAEIIALFHQGMIDASRDPVNPPKVG